MPYCATRCNRLSPIDTRKRVQTGAGNIGPTYTRRVEFSNALGMTSQVEGAGGTSDQKQFRHSPGIDSPCRPCAGGIGFGNEGGATKTSRRSGVGDSNGCRP